MRAHVKGVNSRLLTRRCVACGHDDPGLANDPHGHCPICGVDLGERPPRSYAELEGILTEPDAFFEPSTLPDAHPNVMHRWLLFMLFALFLLLMIIVLSMAMMPV